MKIIRNLAPNSPKAVSKFRELLKNVAAVLSKAAVQKARPEAKRSEAE